MYQLSATGMFVDPTGRPISTSQRSLCCWYVRSTWRKTTSPRASNSCCSSATTLSSSSISASKPSTSDPKPGPTSLIVISPTTLLLGFHANTTDSTFVEHPRVDGNHGSRHVPRVVGDQPRDGVRDVDRFHHHDRERVHPRVCQPGVLLQRLPHHV